MKSMPAKTEVFEAISCPARRQIMDLLVEGGKPVKEIASRFAMSRPAISQHLGILLAVGLVSKERVGREHHYQLEPQKLTPVKDWLAFYEGFWSDNLTRLGAHLAKRNSP